MDDALAPDGQAARPQNACTPPRNQEQSPKLFHHLQGPPEAQWLLSREGRNFVLTELNTAAAPETAVERVQSRGALANEQCQPLLGLLDDLGKSRSEVYFSLLTSAADVLKQRIPTLPQGVLLKLLEATYPSAPVCPMLACCQSPLTVMQTLTVWQSSFPFVSIEHLQEVPLLVLSCLKPVPAAFLKAVRAAST